MSALFNSLTKYIHSHHIRNPMTDYANASTKVISQQSAVRY